ncbi:hypothetical protein CapIbe_023962 [Capra ibex]
MEEGTERNLHSGHMVYMTALMEDMLTEISEWLENHPQEEVILACRNLEGMMEDLHEYLKCCIKNIFGDMLCACDFIWADEFVGDVIGLNWKLLQG